jgi:hypothetical protein
METCSQRNLDGFGRLSSLGIPAWVMFMSCFQNYRELGHVHDSFESKTPSPPSFGQLNGGDEQIFDMREPHFIKFGPTAN